MRRSSQSTSWYLGRLSLARPRPSCVALASCAPGPHVLRRAAPGSAALDLLAAPWPCCPLQRPARWPLGARAAVPLAASCLLPCASATLSLGALLLAASYAGATPFQLQARVGSSRSPVRPSCLQHHTCCAMGPPPRVTWSHPRHLQARHQLLGIPMARHRRMPCRASARPGNSAKVMGGRARRRWLPRGLPSWCRGILDSR